MSFTLMLCPLVKMRRMVVLVMTLMKWNDAVLLLKSLWWVVLQFRIYNHYYNDHFLLILSLLLLSPLPFHQQYRYRLHRRFHHAQTSPEKEVERWVGLRVECVDMCSGEPMRGLDVVVNKTDKADQWKRVASG